MSDDTLDHDDDFEVEKKPKPSYLKPDKYDPNYEIHLINGLYEDFKVIYESEGFTWHLNPLAPWQSLELMMVEMCVNKQDCMGEFEAVQKYLTCRNKTIRQSYDETNLKKDVDFAIKWYEGYKSNQFCYNVDHVVENLDIEKIEQLSKEKRVNYYDQHPEELEELLK